jgi:hypothetical protein
MAAPLAAGTARMVSLACQVGTTILEVGDHADDREAAGH